MCEKRQINALVRSLIQGHFGCLEAAMEAINAGGGNVSLGTMSKRMSGQLDWPHVDIMRLEDAADDYPVTRMAQRRISRGGALAPIDLLKHAGVASKEGGEAVAALILAGSDPDNPESIASAMAETGEAIQAFQGVLAQLEQQYADRGAGPKLASSK